MSQEGGKHEEFGKAGTKLSYYAFPRVALVTVEWLPMIFKAKTNKKNDKTENLEFFPIICFFSLQHCIPQE